MRSVTFRVVGLTAGRPAHSEKKRMPIQRDILGHSQTTIWEGDLLALLIKSQRYCSRQWKMILKAIQRFFRATLLPLGQSAKAAEAEWSEWAGPPFSITSVGGLNTEPHGWDPLRELWLVPRSANSGRHGCLHLDFKDPAHLRAEWTQDPSAQTLGPRQNITAYFSHWATGGDFISPMG